MFGGQKNRSEMGIGIGWFIGEGGQVGYDSGLSCGTGGGGGRSVAEVSNLRRRPGMEANLGQRDQRLY